mgnify:CR=1 FL=1
MKEVIMKKIVIWVALIIGLVSFIGSCSSDDSKTATTSTLSAPSGVTATLGYYQVAVDWTAVSGASSYTVYWGSSTGISSSSTAITGITDDNYTHSGRDNGTTYYYKVATVDSAGTGSLSSEVSATPRDAPTINEACTDNESASGSLQGVLNTAASGTFYHSFYGAEPSNGCINADNISTVFGSSNIPSDALSVKHALVIAGNGTEFRENWHFYSDNACAVETGYTSTSYDNLAIADNISIAGGSPAAATEVWYTKTRTCALAETDTVETMIESKWGVDVLTKGTVLDISDTDDNSTTIWTVLDNISSTTLNYLYTSSALSNSTYPDNWSSSTTWHAGDNITR